jgi:rhodanese-related sulfurtransferase
MSPDAYAELVASGQPHTLVDVREPQELAGYGQISGNINIPLGTLPYSLGQIPAEKDAKIILLCQAGIRSMTAADFLASQGYTDLHNLTGGYMAWKAAGHS